MHLHELLWYTNVGLEGLIVLSMFRKAYFRAYTTFFALMLCGLLQSIVLLLITQNKQLYLWAYWIFEIADSLLIAAVLQDIFERISSGDAEVAKWSRRAFFACSTIAVIIATVAASRDAGSGVGPVNAFGLRSEQGFRIIQAILVVFVVSYTFLFRPLWDLRSRWIFLGIGFLVAAETVTVSEYLGSGAATFVAFKWIKPLAFTCAFLLWLSAFWKRVPEDVQTGHPGLQRFEEQLQSVVSR